MDENGFTPGETPEDNNNSPETGGYPREESVGNDVGENGTENERRSTEYPYGESGNGGYPYRGDPFVHSSADGNFDPNWNKPESRYPYDSQSYTEAKPEQKKKKGGLTAFAAVLAVIVILASVGMGYGIAGRKNNKGEAVPPSQGNIPAGTNRVSGIEDGPTMAVAAAPETGATSPAGPDGVLDAAGVYSKIYDSSVGILVYTSSSQFIDSEGSGIILSEDSAGKYTYIITCAHCIDEAGATVYVKPNDSKEEYKAEIVGYDSRTDIGVIRIKAVGFTPAQFGDSDSVKVGQTVYAIGNPGGSEFAGSFTRGMVSAISRPVSSDTGYTMKCIQHDAAINPGNSGGALVNEYGQVVGINSMKIVSTDYEGMGFAVPSNITKEVVNSLIANGYVPNRPKLGISYRLASYYNAYNMVVQLRNLPSGTVIIESVSEDSPLKKTRVQKYDLIVAVNGKELADVDTLREYVEQSSVGDVLRLSMVRVKKDYSVEEFEVQVALVEDKGVTVVETTTEADVLDPESGEDADFVLPF